MVLTYHYVIVIPFKVIKMDINGCKSLLKVVLTAGSENEQFVEKISSVFAGMEFLRLVEYFVFIEDKKMKAILSRIILEKKQDFLQSCSGDDAWRLYCQYCSCRALDQQFVADIFHSVQNFSVLESLCRRLLSREEYYKTCGYRSFEPVLLERLCCNAETFDDAVFILSRFTKKDFGKTKTGMAPLVELFKQEKDPEKLWGICCEAIDPYREALFETAREALFGLTQEEVPLIFWIGIYGPLHSSWHYQYKDQVKRRARKKELLDAILSRIKEYPQVLTIEDFISVYGLISYRSMRGWAIDDLSHNPMKEFLEETVLLGSYSYEDWLKLANIMVEKNETLCSSINWTKTPSVLEFFFRVVKKMAELKPFSIKEIVASWKAWSWETGHDEFQKATKYFSPIEKKVLRAFCQEK